MKWLIVVLITWQLSRPSATFLIPFAKLAPSAPTHHLSPSELITNSSRLCCICLFLFVRIGKWLDRRPISERSVVGAAQAVHLCCVYSGLAMIKCPNHCLAWMRFIFLRRTNYCAKLLLTA